MKRNTFVLYPQRLAQHMSSCLCVPTMYILSRNMKNIRVFYLKKIQFLEVEFYIYI